MESLRFPPYFSGVLSASALGPLADLWMRLSERERQSLVRFEREYRRAHRLELLGETGRAAEVHRRLAIEFRRFRVIALERLASLGAAMEDAEHTRG